MEFDGYLNSYNEVFAKVGDKDVALFILSQVAKDRRTEQINKNGETNGNVVEKATQSQLSYLKKLGIEAKQSLSKGEASRLIDEAKMK